MATTYTPRGPMDEGVIGGMSDVATQLMASTFSQDAMAGSMNTQPSPHVNLSPPPNPPFMFPAHPSSTPFSFSRTTGRRHQSAIDIPKIGLDMGYTDSRRPSGALPDFRFNPGHSLGPENNGRRPRPPPLPDFSFSPADTPTDSSLLTPSFAPPSPRTAPIHMGHRRGGSEFVGGKLKSGEMITVMSTSPTKSESDFGSPTLAPSIGPRKHQRGHSHRRSGAISSHDLSLILQKTPDHSPKGSSAPPSPAGLQGQNTPNVKNEKTVEATATNAGEIATAEERPFAEKPSQFSPELSPRPATRARVGFSDTLEFIPRPLSLVSTDTASTVRPGHSVSGSISSVASATTSTNPDRDSRAIVASPVPHPKSGSRPSTAGAVLERTSSLHMAVEGSPSTRRRNSIPILNDIAQVEPTTSTVSTPTKAPKRWSFFGLDSFATNGSPTRARPSSSSSETAKRSSTNIVPSPGGDVVGQDSVTSQDAPPTTEKKPGKKRQKKVKSWAGSILTRKSKSRAQKSKARRSQTPPIPRLTKDENMDHELSENSNQLSGTTFEIDLIQPIVPTSGTTKHRRTHVEDEMPYPMIDLDAALGPFNTPTRDPQWDEAQRSGAPPKRQLHSAAGLRGFSGPGMHYHRRTESAPEMPPFEGGWFNIHRFGSSLTMADVFEEDEEDDSGDHTGESAVEDSTSESQDTTTGDEDEGRDTEDAVSTPTQEHSINLENPHADVLQPSSIKRKESGSSLDLPAPGKLQNENSSKSLRNAVIEEEQSSFSSAKEAMFTIPSNPSDLAAPSHHRDANQMETTPPDATSIILSGSLTMPISPYSVNHSSSFPSPHSPMSHDAQRISTAPSSATDENNFRSLLMGEPGPEVVRLSFEVPSLTSTNSNTTRESGFMSGVRPRNTPFYEQRPASFTSTAFGRRRSSLASLSRLISSAHGERSKLSMEVPCETEEKKAKPSKSKRLTKMIQFWKPKASGGS
ncbi:hypothetical protein F4861DRAFT_12001 [Xylaria intraflava]|nr:hypothetical protein F4861DRAFT_12001 [Xylaria intraflava]